MIGTMDDEEDLLGLNSLISDHDFEVEGRRPSDELHDLDTDLDCAHGSSTTALRRRAARVGHLLQWAMEEVEAGDFGAADALAVQALRATAMIKEHIGGLLQGEQVSQRTAVIAARTP